MKVGENNSRHRRVPGSLTLCTCQEPTRLTKCSMKPKTLLSYCYTAERSFFAAMIHFDMIVVTLIG